MEAGKLDQRIDIEQVTETPDGSGGQTQTWGTFASRLPAGIQTANGSEQWRAAQVDPNLTHAIKIRFYAGISPKMRVKWYDPWNKRTRYFGIDSIPEPDHRGRELNLLCIEDVDG